MKARHEHLLNFQSHEGGFTLSTIECAHLGIGLIHHSDAIRCAPIFDLAEQIALQRSAPPYLPGSSQDCGCGVNFVPFHHAFDQFTRIQIEAAVKGNWNPYLSTVFQRLRDVNELKVSTFKKLYLFTRFIMSKDSWSRNNLISRSIESLLFDKHIYLWTILANSALPGMIIFEDDCRQRKDSNISNFYSEMVDLSREYDYVDLAGGFSFQELGLSDSDSHNFDSIMTNTTCAYFISKQLAQHAVRTLQVFPSKRYLGVGFFLNQIDAPRGKVFRSILFKEPFFSHGSFTGDVRSTIAERTER